MKPNNDAPSRMLRLDSLLWGEIETAAKRAGRTFRQEVERRLHRSLHGESSDALTPTAVTKKSNSQPVRLSNELLDVLRPEATASGRSLPMEIEHRLRQSSVEAKPFKKQAYFSHPPLKPAEQRLTTRRDFVERAVSRVLIKSYWFSPDGMQGGCEDRELLAVIRAANRAYDAIGQDVHSNEGGKEASTNNPLEDDAPVRPSELAKALGCSRTVVDKALRDGLIPHLRLGRGIFIPRRVAAEITRNGRIPEIPKVAP